MVYRARKPYVENPHIRLVERDAASAVMLRLGNSLCKKLVKRISDRFKLVATIAAIFMLVDKSFAREALQTDASIAEVIAFKQTVVTRFKALTQSQKWADVPKLVDGLDAESATRRVAAETLVGQCISAVDVGEGEYSLAFGEAKARLSVLDFKTSGLVHVFACWSVGGSTNPVYWMSQGYESVIDATSADAEGFLKKHILGPPSGKVVRGGVKTKRGDKIIGQFSKREYQSAFGEGWFFFIDDQATANWSHPARYVFLKKDLSAALVWYCNEPTSFTVSGTQESYPLPIVVNACALDLTSEAKAINQTRKAVENAISQEENAISFSGDASKSYAILISGGYNINNNHTRYWGDTAAMYSTLTKKYGIPKDHITVCMSDGTSSEPDLSSGSTGFYYDENGWKKYFKDQSHTSFTDNSSPLDLDGDGEADVGYDARKNTIQSVFNSMASSLSADDQLFVLVTDHGGYDEVYDTYSVCLWNEGKMSPTEFAALTANIACPVALAMEFCYSGAFIDEIKKQPNRVIATAGGKEPTSAFSGENLYYINPWVFAFVTALRGAQPLIGVSPWQDAANAIDESKIDADGNGLISIQEAWDYSYNFCKTTMSLNETPAWGESSSGLGKTFFILNQSKPVAPTIPSAPSPYLDTTTSTTLKWSAVSGAKYYRVYRSENPFSDPQPYSNWITSTSSTIVAPSSRSTVYYYWVKAASQANEKTASGFSTRVKKSTDTEYDVVQEDPTSSIEKNLSDSKLMLYGRKIKFGSLYGDMSSATCALTINGSSVALGSTYYGPTSGLSLGDTASVRYTWTANTSSSPRHAYYTADCSPTVSGLSGNLKMGGGIYNDHHFFQAGKISLVAGTSSVSASADCKAYTIDVTCTPATTAWSASVNKDWVTLYKTSSKGSGILGFIVDENTGSSRKATITFKSGGTTYATVAVNQAAGTSSPVTYTLTRYPNGGTYKGSTGATTAANGLVVGTTAYCDIGVPTRSGYVFTGWFTASSGGTKVYGSDGKCVAGGTYWDSAKKYKYAGDLTVYAQWVPAGAKYNLTRYPNGGTYKGSTGATTAANGLVLGTTAYWDIGVPTRSGYVFTGWFTASSGGTKVYGSDGKCVAGGAYWDSGKKYKYAGNLTVYAQWKAADPFAEALDNAWLTFKTGGDAKWFSQSTYTFDGVDAARSGTIDHAQESWLETTVSGRGTIAFYWSVSSEAGYDKLEFLIDGELRNCIDGEDKTWRLASFPINSGGSHVLRWRYIKDGSVSKGQDAGFVDHITWTPASAQVVVPNMNPELANGKSEADTNDKSESLPEWAVGTFDGAVAGADGGVAGVVTLTVSEGGEVSGKMLKDGLVRTLTADEATFAIDESSPFRRVVATGDGWVAWQNQWNTEPFKTAAEAFAEAPALVTPEGVELKFSASGAVTAKFGAHSCSSTLIPLAADSYSLFLYFPPKAGEFEGYAAEVKLVWDGTEFSLEK